jgi:hypothetical protein
VDRFGAGKAENTRVMRGRVGRIRECFHPRLDRSKRTELDTVEKVYLGPRNPLLGNKATCLERDWFIAEMVNDEVEDLWRKGGQHRGVTYATRKRWLGSLGDF